MSSSPHSSSSALKVYVGDLQLGMYVCELDRPWLETDFLLQGFPIHNEDELCRLQETCQYVYVDLERTPEELRRRLLTRSAGSGRANPVWPQKPAASFRGPVAFSEELEHARRIYDESRRYVTRALDDARLGRAIDTRQARVLVEQMAESIVRNDHALVWLTQLKARDEYILTHCINVSILALSFGRHLGLAQDRLIELGLGALLHDLGKMQVPLEILNKPGRLTAEEFAVVKRHPEYGHALLTRHDSDVPAPVLDIVRHHHERLDGQGYPDGLPAYTIPPLTRIASIVDVYDAITSDRVYHDGMTPHDALGNLFRWAPGNFDKQLIEEFIRCLGIYPVGSLVELNTGEVAVVATFNEAHRLKPTVLLILDSDKQPYPRRTLLNLANEHWEDRRIPPAITRVLDRDAYGINLTAIVKQEALQ